MHFVNLNVKKKDCFLTIEMRAEVSDDKGKIYEKKLVDWFF